MSFLTSVRASINPRLTLRQPYTAVSAFHTSSARPGLKESDHNRENLGSIYESHKQEQLKSRKEGKANWSQDLASNSEASVKADRGEADGEKNFQDLQNRTKNAPRR